MPDFHGSRIAVVEELNRCGWTWEWGGDTTVKTCCPFHDDANPSATLDVKTGSFKCFTAGCQASGDFVKFMARVLSVPRAVVVVDFQKRYGLIEEKTISAQAVERYHAAVWSALPLLGELTARGVSRESIQRWRIGEDKGRLIIPVKNDSGLYVNVRKYLPGAPGAEKMKNARGHGKPIRLYPVEQMGHDIILLCGGEVKALAAIEHLERHGIGCVSTTGGEGNWEAYLTERFKNKTVLVCMDIDDEGKKAAKNTATVIHRVAKSVGVVDLPLDVDAFPHGDLNDYLMQPGADLLALLGEVDEFVPLAMRADFDAAEPTEPATLAKACTAESGGKRMIVGAVVSAIQQAPYVVPAEFHVRCGRDQEVCGLCPHYNNEEDHVYKVSPESPEILTMAGSPKGAQLPALMETVGIPSRCKVCRMETLTLHNVEDVRLSPRLEIASRATERDMLPAVIVSDGVELNETYSMTCRMHPHPMTQQSTLVVSKAEVSDDALTSFKLQEPHRLQVFQGDPAVMLPRIYDDLEANVTRVYQRRDVHMMADLAYHSPLFIPFDGRNVKGWVEVLIIGDSSQGKSEATERLREHYQVGTKVECRNVSVAGLLGGLEQIAGKWFVKWGVIPTHDKRLVVLEELKGAKTDVIARLTDMRSTGVAEIPKIEKRRTHARTRLIAISNPRAEMPMSSYNFGLETIPELIGGLEDVRRFDAAIAVAEGDVDASVVNRLRCDRPQVPHVYTSELCRDLVLWAWTREASQVHFVNDAERLILARAVAMTEVYAEAVPLVDKGSQWNKIARLSASLAARLFSTDDGERLLVTPQHVNYACDFLDRVYTSDTLGYRAFSEALKASTELRDPDQIKTAIEQTPYAKDFCDQILHAIEVDAQDIQDWCGWDRQNAGELVSLLVRKRALVREHRHYRKTPEFIKLLKEIIEGSVHPQDRPACIPEGGEF